jgi:adenine-specific DNA-methyltransferase
VECGSQGEGGEDSKYNNDYVDDNDTYRHSKWLSMMKHRLSVAKNVLKSNGVLICAIDDNEVATLSLLLAEIFPEKILNTVVISNNPHGVARSGFSRTHEYAIFLLNPGQTINKKPAPEDVRNINLRRSGNNSLRADSPTMFYPIFVSKKELKIIGVGEVPDKSFHPKSAIIENKDRYEVWPVDDKGIEKNWYYSRTRVAERGATELNCRFIKGKLQISFHHSNNAEQTYKSVWMDSAYDAGAYGATIVKDITKNNFPFPKSINTVTDCLKAVLQPDTAIILDFFAGSGTTGHAVLALNKEDGGKRKFILCTNNEGGICEDITYPRLKGVIKGYKNYLNVRNADIWNILM